MGYWKEKMMEDEATGVNFVKELISGGYLEGAALGVAKQWVSEGDESLSPKQAAVLKRYVFEPFVTEHCKFCSQVIPWSEMLAAHENGGMCGWCQNGWEKLRDE